MGEITRLFLPSSLAIGDTVDFSEEERHHLYTVLRGRAGDRVEIVDGTETLFVAELLGGREATVLEERSAGQAGDWDVTLYQAIPKGRHMDMVVEKSTELGVNRIVPLETERGVVRLSKGDGKVLRWRRVAEAAARQALRFRVPEVGEVLPLSEAVHQAGEVGVLLNNEIGLPLLEDVVPSGGKVSLFVGPEGGWSEGELAMVRDVGLALASLGPYRLRSETAGMVAVARAHSFFERASHVREDRW